MNSFDFKDVSLDDSILKNVLTETMDFYLNIPNNNILKYMRESAGLPAPGIYYTGWFPNSRGIALIGQWISAYSRMYAITQKEDFRKKALFLSAEFWHCYELAQNTDPFFTSHSHYDIEKLLRAQCDLYLYCNCSDAPKYAAYLIDFADQHLTRDNLFGDNSTEWYTLPESCLDVWEVFGIEKALHLAKQFEYREFWNLFYKDEDPFSKRPIAGLYSEYCHAYSHTNSFNSCAKSYEVTHDPYYLKSLHSFYHFMLSEEIMATGGYGPNFEHLMPKYRIIDALRTGHDSFETQCDTYAAYRLVKYLTCLTGKPSYGNWAESLFYNATAATIPMTKDGKVIYYSDYNMYGGMKVNRQDGWTCCTGTRPLLVSEIQRLLYFEDNGDLYISQYTPSTLNWKRAEGIVKLHQKTMFPLQDTTELHLTLSTPQTFSIHLRMPSWLADTMVIYKNGELMESIIDEKGWLTISSIWQNQDIITIILPQNIWMHSFDPIKKGPNAFLHGPIVLAAEYTGKQTPNDWMDVQTLAGKMQAVKDQPLHYTVEGEPNITFKPFYEFKEYERYFLYHDTTAHASKIHKNNASDLKLTV